ncbi:Putative organic solute transporter subunit alpha/Transmembrane protein [Colletotrichum destructivum]|uniref:Organic solute transporter subunit alpha/Transmembrane protein n=1 Tax=Colletotrichum destructivum TaxID=34406 RepID=A0AAX4J465_9PEZI|nr:Putative organic solute transporter subunit alpha/Transmembrane protein [Colletotrichum destructivum]
MPKCTDHPLDVPILEKEIGGGGIRVHGLLLCLAGASTIVASSASAYLIFRHASNYTNPKQQKLIIRILLMVPIYSIACTLSIEFYKENVYLGSIYEFYESLVIASFFLLLCQYLHPDLTMLRRVFQVVDPKPWIHPIRFFVTHVGRNKKSQTVDGLRRFNIIWFGVFQFCIVKFLGALTKCITEALDVYCEESKSAGHAKIWVMIIEILSLVTAMLCLFQFYNQTNHVISHHRPMLKFVAIKLVVFLFYLQTFIFDFLTRKDGPIEPSATISYPSWAVGIPNTLLCLEMAAVSVLHFWAFPYDVYKKGPSSKKTSNNNQDDALDIDQDYTITRISAMQNCEPLYQRPDSDNLTEDGIWNGPASAHRHTEPIGSHTRGSRWQALVDTLNFIDIFWAVAGASRWLVGKRREGSAASDAGGEAHLGYHSEVDLAGQSRRYDFPEALIIVEGQAFRDVSRR